MPIERCQFHSSCQVAKFVKDNCPMYWPHTYDEEHQKGFNCPLGITFGHSSWSKCYTIKEEQ
jgi:hypothetical protein